MKIPKVNAILLVYSTLQEVICEIKNTFMVRKVTLEFNNNQKRLNYARFYASNTRLEDNFLYN